MHSILQSLPMQYLPVFHNPGSSSSKTRTAGLQMQIKDIQAMFSLSLRHRFLVVSNCVQLVTLRYSQV